MRVLFQGRGARSGRDFLAFLPDPSACLIPRNFLALAKLFAADRARDFLITSLLPSIFFTSVIIQRSEVSQTVAPASIGIESVLLLQASVGPAGTHLPVAMNGNDTYSSRG
jgi:hypothetical protein